MEKIVIIPVPKPLKPIKMVFESAREIEDIVNLTDDHYLKTILDESNEEKK